MQGVHPYIVGGSANCCKSFGKTLVTYLQIFLPFELLTLFLRISPKELNPYNEKSFLFRDVLFILYGIVKIGNHFNMPRGKILK